MRNFLDPPDTSKPTVTWRYHPSLFSGLTHTHPDSANVSQSHRAVSPIHRMSVLLLYLAYTLHPEETPDANPPKKVIEAALWAGSYCNHRQKHPNSIAGPPRKCRKARLFISPFVAFCCPVVVLLPSHIRPDVAFPGSQRHRPILLCPSCFRLCHPSCRAFPCP